MTDPPDPVPGSAQAALAWFEAHPEIADVFAGVCDIHGALRGKRMAVEQVAKALEGRVRMPSSVLGVDIWGCDVIGNAQVFETGDADCVCEPTGRGPVPSAAGARPSVLVPLWMAHEDGTPNLTDPRRALAAVVERFSTLGLCPVVALELEFYLYDPESGTPQPPRLPTTGQRLCFDGVLSLSELEAFDGFFDDLYRESALQGIRTGAAIAENGCGQFEVNLEHGADALRAADDALLFKRLVRAVARRHGFAATFMARPYGERSGSGMHLHLSLLDEDGRNVFDDGTDAGSELLHSAIAGMLALMPQTTLLFAPHLNSYRRLRPDTHAPVAVAWGYENRTTALRIPGGDPRARRIEHRVAGADANPYLVTAAVLGAALHGLERGLPSPPPVSGDAYAQRLPPLPYDWASALAAFDRGEHVGDICCPALHRMIVACKRQEQAAFAARVTELEYQSYLEVV